MHDALEAARAVAFRYLGVSARSRAEIERRLIRGGFEADIVAAVADELTAAGWLDDVKFAQDWVEDRADRKRYGRGRLAAELQRRGVDRETAGAALDAIDETAELRRARAAARQRWQPERLMALDPAARQAEKRRCSDFLQRRGFGWSIIVQVLAELMVKEE